MRKKLLLLAPAVALTLVAQCTPALAAATASPAPSSSASAAPGNRTARQFDLWSRLSPAEWDETLEESCIEDGSAACKMTAGQVAKLPADIQKLAAQMRKEILANPAELAELKKDRALQPRGIGSAARSLTRTLTKYASNPAVRKLSAKADQIGDIAGYATDATYVAGGLAENTEVAYAKTVLAMVPVLGDVFSLADAISSGDVEGGVVSIVSLIGTAVAVACPPAGAVIAVGLAIYYVGKMIWGWLCAKPRDWIADPPGTPQELFESGADIRWETHRVAGKDVAVTVSATGTKKRGTTTQTLLLDSKWTEYNSARQPVKYTFKPGSELSYRPRWLVTKASYKIWQNGAAAASGTCTATVVPASTAGLGSGGVKVECAPTGAVTISLGHPAVLQVSSTYVTRNDLKCGTLRPPCIPADSSLPAYLSVYSESAKRVRLDLPYTYAIV